MSGPGPQPELLQWASELIGPISAAEFAGWDHGESAVWRLDTADRSAFLKVHRQARKYRQEVHAYREWASGLGGAAPTLLAARPAEIHRQPGAPDDRAPDEAGSTPGALLLSAAPGQVALGTRFEFDDEVHRRAGRILRRMHELPHVDDDRLSLVDALGERLQRYCDRAAAVGETDLARWVAGRVEPTLPLLVDGARVPCHRDFTPRNWLVTEAGEVHVIDFEHSVPDLWLLDVERLRSAWWVGRPNLAEAFWDGYGRRPSPTDETIIGGIAPLTALGTVVWAREHGDPAFEDEGRRALRDLGWSG